MRFYKILILLCLLFSCRQEKRKLPTNINELIFRQSQTILNAHDKKIWNLHSIDTSDVKIYKGCFISPNDSALFISIFGDAGLSAGNANRLNLIAYLKDTLIIKYYEQGAIPDTILDFNNDGVEDFFMNVGSTWMGSCMDNYILKTFKNGKEEILFERHDDSVLECGGLIEESKKIGDTLLTSRSFVFRDLDNDKTQEIIMTTEYKIHNGGKKLEEILDSIRVIRSIDTIKIRKN